MYKFGLVMLWSKFAHLKPQSADIDLKLIIKYVQQNSSHKLKIVSTIANPIKIETVEANEQS